MGHEKRYSPGDLEGAINAFNEYGFVVLKEAVSPSDLDTIETDLEAAQRELIDGKLDNKYGSDLLDEPGATFAGKAFRHYVINCTELSATASCCKLARDPK